MAAAAGPAYCAEAPRLSSPCRLSSPLSPLPPPAASPRPFAILSSPPSPAPSLSLSLPLHMSDPPPGASPWLSSLRSALRLLSIVLSAAVACLLVHTLEIYRGNISLDLRKGELPMTWPARTNLWPTLVLFAIAAANFLASLVILFTSFKRALRRPMRTRDLYRVVAGSFGVVLWATALAVYYLIDKSSKASLGRYACTNRNVLSNGRFQYRTVCSEQGVAFYLAICAASCEILTLITLAASAIHSAKRAAPLIKHDVKSEDEKPLKR